MDNVNIVNWNIIKNTSRLLVDSLALIKYFSIGICTLIDLIEGDLSYIVK